MDIENILTSNNITAEKLNLTSNDFVHLHVHSSYSILDGVCKPKDLAKKAKKLGMSSIAITDHNHLGGTIAFQDACNDEGVKPLLGYEGYYTLDTKIEKLTAEERHKKALLDAIEAGVDIKDKEILLNDIDKLNKNTLTKLYKNNLELVKDYEYDTKQYHILYLAMNQTGWNNLIRLQSKSSSICTYNGRFIADMDLIRKYSEGVICTVACVGSYPADMVYKDRKDKNKEKEMTLEAEEFIRRFLLHILPPGFMKIRHYGLLGNRNKKTKLAICKKLTNTANFEPQEINTLEILKKTLGVDFNLCPFCKTGHMINPNSA